MAIFAYCIVIVEPSWGTRNNINVIYTSLKSTFIAAYSILQFCRWQYGSIFIRLTVVCTQICDIAPNYEKIRTYSSSRSCNVTDLGANLRFHESALCNFLLVINRYFGRISYRFRDIDV